MMQTRAGTCSKCKEPILPGAETCPACGAKQSWIGSEEQLRRKNPAPQSTSGAPSESRSFQASDAIRWLAYLCMACLLIFLALALRNWVLSDSQSASSAASHGLRVRDSETFREQVFASRTSPSSPESKYVVGIAMPAGSDVLEITLRNEWQLLSYEERLKYANLYANRWKKIHAPHRSYFSLFDSSGEEIGGRIWTGKVWVKETHGAVKPQRKSAPKEAPKPAQ